MDVYTSNVFEFFSKEKEVYYLLWKRGSNRKRSIIKDNLEKKKSECISKKVECK